MPVNVYMLMGRTQAVVEYLKRQIQKHHQVLAHLSCMSQHKHCSSAWSENSACVSGNISESVLQGGGEKGASSPRRQLTGEVLRPVAAQRGRAALAWPALACLFITERAPLKALLCHLRSLLFFPLGN